MNRFNYNRSLRERLLGELPLHALSERLRIPLAVVGIALSGVACAWTLETHRIAGLDGELATLQAQVQSAAQAQARAQRLITIVDKGRSLRAGIAAARRDGIAVTNTIARIGNDLPAQTWLTNVGAAPNGAWTISGRSTRVGEIGMMLRRVQSIDRTAPARLVSIAATGRSGHILDFVIGWERHP